jgi:RimJ/RimL family protein N-acetyltransferase
MSGHAPGTPATGIHLRDVLEEDLPVLFEHQWDPEANRMAAFPARDREAFMAHWKKNLKEPTNIHQTIVLDGAVAGSMLCFGDASKRMVGYWIGREYWGRGIASRALADFLGQVKDRPLYAYVAKHNAASLRVLAKNGFTICGEDEAPGIDGENVAMCTLRLDPAHQDHAP